MEGAANTIVGRWLPGLVQVKSYHRKWLTEDLVVGLVLSALLVPQGMAYAELAGLPPVTGLYTSNSLSWDTQCSDRPESWCWGQIRRWVR